MKNELPAKCRRERQHVYCIRCGKPLFPGEALYSEDDPDCEEALCDSCYRRFECGRKDQIKGK